MCLNGKGAFASEWNKFCSNQILRVETFSWIIYFWFVKSVLLDFLIRFFFCGNTHSFKYAHCFCARKSLRNSWSVSSIMVFFKPTKHYSNVENSSKKWTIRWMFAIGSNISNIEIDFVCIWGQYVIHNVSNSKISNILQLNIEQYSRKLS